MKKRKFLAILTAATMVLSMTACGGSDAPTSGEAENTQVNTESQAPDTTAPETETQAPSQTPEPEVQGPVSVDFEDGLFGFVGLDKSVNPAADDSSFEVASFNGSNALKVTTQGKPSFTAIQMDAMLGDKISEVKSVELSIGTETASGTFYATSGNVYVMAGEDNAQTSAAWSVYLANKNPKTVTYTVPDGVTLTAGNYMVVSLETDNASEAGELSTYYIDNIAFKDASGNVIEADTSAEYVAVETGEDRSNLFGTKDAIVVENLSGKLGAWSQLGDGITEEEFAALCTPGSVVEVSYTSTTGNMWIILPWSNAGWMRVGVGDCDGSGQEYSYLNNSKNIAQITYEQIAAICGDDPSTWGQCIQCESDGDFEVYSVKIAQQAPNYCLTNTVDAGISGKLGAWGQLGEGLSEEAFAALTTPGSVVEIEYTTTSPDGAAWIVMPWAEAGWKRVGVGDHDGSGQEYAMYDGNKCYVTYEQIANICGEDASTWGQCLQVESDGDFEVYSVKIGQGTQFVPNKKQIDAGISGKLGGWSQLGDGISEDVFAALTTPGSVINISYTSATGECWVVIPWAEAGWKRIGVGDFDGSGQGYAVYDGSNCQITYDMIAEYCGEDASTWGQCIQVEATSDFEVYSVTVGQTK